MRAQCQCGQLSATVTGETDQIVACHCTDCQRRTGAPFGVIAYYPAAQVTLSGDAREFTRTSAAGNAWSNGFCPACGSTVWCRGEAKPGTIGIPVGAFADPGYPLPVRSVWEQSMHEWVPMPAGIARFPQGRM